MSEPRRNRYPGTCACGAAVPAGAGILRPSAVRAVAVVVCSACEADSERRIQGAEEQMRLRRPDRAWRRR